MKPTRGLSLAYICYSRGAAISEQYKLFCLGVIFLQSAIKLWFQRPSIGTPLCVAKNFGETLQVEGQFPWFDWRNKHEMGSQLWKNDLMPFALQLKKCSFKFWIGKSQCWHLFDEGRRGLPTFKRSTWTSMEVSNELVSWFLTYLRDL